MTGLVIVFANLKEKKIGGIPSNGMVMCASDENHEKCEIMRPPEDSEIGERV